ncbi:MAG TPA: histidine kinase dimerization/phospho-acceptor domain-containing protein, partial [Gemmataceae bacterium]|nr:histidine kinase dimerization/phospho-acceptor domain-containing protein [Gemmataceae bacterium]
MNGRLLVRVTGPIVVISLFLLALGVVAAWYVHRLQKNVSRVVVEDVASVRAAEELEIGIREVQAQLSHFLLTGNRTHLEAVPEMRRETGEWLDRAERLAETRSECALIARVRRGYDHLFQEFDRVAADRGAVAREVRQLVDDVINKEILPPAHAYLDENEKAAERTSRKNEAMARRLALALVVLGGCGAAAGLLAGYGIARGISRSIVRLSVPVRDAAGKLNEVIGPVTLSAGWGFEELGEALCRVAEQVGTVVERLQRSERELLRGEQLAALGQLAAGLAHELRNPLMAMKLLLQAARPQGPGMARLSER